MQPQTEPVIKQQWRAQITPARYLINNEFNNYEYTMINKINCNSVNLLNFSIYNAFPNLNFFYKQITVKIGTTTYPIIIPQVNLNNFWDIFDLLTILQTQFNAQTPDTWSFVLAGNNNKFVQITNTSGHQFNLVWGYSLEVNQIARYIGFGNQDDSIYIGSPQTQFLSQFPYNVQVTQNINVQIRGIGNLNSETVACIAQIPIGQIGQLISWESPFYQFARQIIDKHNKYPVQRITISLLDDLSNPLIINDNRISLTLLFEEFEQ